MTVRLNKFIAECTGISRRKADDLIEEGKVTVDGRRAKIGDTLKTGQELVKVEGRLIRRQRKLYVVLHKPKGVITTRSDPEGRKTIYDVLPEKYHHLDPAGRLDRESSGMLILSNDGDFIQTLTHPKHGHIKVYRVKVDKVLTPQVLQQLEKGIHLMPEDKLATCRVQSIVDQYTVVLMLKTGLNRQIRRSFEALGYHVEKLKRTAIGSVSLGSLSSGRARELRPGEIKALKRF